jgi:hypothetical protein
MLERIILEESEHTEEKLRVLGGLDLSSVRELFLNRALREHPDWSAGLFELALPSVRYLFLSENDLQDQHLAALR